MQTTPDDGLWKVQKRLEQFWKLIYQFQPKTKILVMKLSSATTLGQNGPVCDCNEGVLHIPQSFSITGASPSDCLVLYSGHSLGKSYPSAEMQLVYSTAPTDWANMQI